MPKAAGRAMIYEVTQTWFNKWKVVEIGHTEGDETWLASFRSLVHAELFLQSLQFQPQPEAER